MADCTLTAGPRGSPGIMVRNVPAPYQVGRTDNSLKVGGNLSLSAKDSEQCRHGRVTADEWTLLHILNTGLAHWVKCHFTFSCAFLLWSLACLNFFAIQASLQHEHIFTLSLHIDLSFDYSLFFLILNGRGFFFSYPVIVWSIFWKYACYFVKITSKYTRTRKSSRDCGFQK